MTISGTAEPGCTLSANAGPGVNAARARSRGGAFTCQVSGMASGNNIITVTATDAAGNTKNVATTVSSRRRRLLQRHGEPGHHRLPQGVENVGRDRTPTTDDLMHGDVSFNNKTDSVTCG